MRAETSWTLPSILWQGIDGDIWEQKILPRLLHDGARYYTIRWQFYTYRRWLTYLRRLQILPAEGAALSLIGTDVGVGYVRALRERTSARTALTEAQGLRRLLTTFEPASDATLIDKTIKLYRAESRYAPRRPQPVVDSQLLLGVGHQILASVQTRAFSSQEPRLELAFRDGLIIALLARRPLRIRNFADLRLHHNLLIRDNTAWFRFSAHETKGGRAAEMPYPQELFQQLLQYLGEIRYKLARQESSDFLWLSDRGMPLSERALRKIIKRRTTEVLGYPVSPHRFRHAAIRHLAINYPDMIGIATDLLWHSDHFVTEAHYNFTPPQPATLRVQENLLAEADCARKEAEERQRQRKRLLHSGS